MYKKYIFNLISQKIWQEYRSFNIDFSSLDFFFNETWYRPSLFVYLCPLCTLSVYFTDTSRTELFAIWRNWNDNFCHYSIFQFLFFASLFYLYITLLFYFITHYSHLFHRATILFSINYLNCVVPRYWSHLKISLLQFLSFVTLVPFSFLLISRQLADTLSKSVEQNRDTCDI